ncbi:MAG: hypothetical protein PHX18_05935 [Candidatus Gastranaerophilales bacterium]|nr:hypothetical protein [Candidatus Gastranaerophilales bacterium]
MKKNIISALVLAGILACSLNQNAAQAGNVTITSYSELPGAGLISGDTLTLDADITVTDDNMQSYYPSGTFTIFGQGNSLDGSSLYEGFTIITPSIYTLNNVTVKNFLRSAGDGGGIHNSASLNLAGTSVIGDSNNAANGSGGFLYNTSSTVSSADNLILTSNTAQIGGAVYNATGATFTATSDISASGNSAVNGQGGAIFNMGTIGIATGTFTSNSSTLDGGAIYNSNNFTASGNLIFGDYTGSVASQGNSVSDGHGGAIYNSGTMDLQGGAEFYDNSAASSLTAHGGAIYNTGTLNIGGTALTAIDNATSNGDGGFLYNSSANTVNITSNNVTLSGNSALSGGAVYNMGTVDFTGTLNASNNTATAGDGGFLYAGAGSSTSIDNATVSNNTASSRGGAIYMEGAPGNAAVVDISASLSDTTFTGNTAGGNSNAIYMNSNSTVNIDSAVTTQVVFNDNIIANALNNNINITSGNVNFNADIQVNAASSLVLTNAGNTQLTTAAITSGTSGNPNTFTVNSNAGSVTSTGAVSVNDYNVLDLNTTSTGTVSLNTVSMGTSSDVNLNAGTADSVEITNLNINGTGNTLDSTGANANIGTVTFSSTSDLTLNTQNLSITTGIVSNGAGTLNKAATGTLDLGSLTVTADNSLTINSNAGDTTFTTASLANAASGNTTLTLNANAGNIASTGAVSVNDDNILNLSNNASGSTLALNGVTMGADSQINIAANNATPGSMDLGAVTVNSTGNTITNTVPANAATLGVITFNNTSDLTLNSAGLDITGVTSSGTGTLNKTATGTQDLGTVAVSADNVLNIISTAGDTTFTTANLTNATTGNTTTLSLTSNGSDISSTGAVSVNDNNTLNLTTDSTGVLSLNEVVLGADSQVRAFSGNSTADSLDLGKLTVNSTGNTVYNNLTSSNAVLGDITLNNTSSLTLGSGNLQIDSIISNGTGTVNKIVAGSQDIGTLTVNSDNALSINSLAGTTTFTTASLANATSGNTVLNLKSDAGTLTSSGLISINDGNILSLTNAVSLGSISLNSVSMGANSQIDINANRTIAGAISLGSLTVNSTGNTVTNTVPANTATLGVITFNNTSDLTLNSGGLSISGVTSDGAGTLNKIAAGTQDLGTLTVNADDSLVINSTAGDTTFTNAGLTSATTGNNSILTLNANGGNIASTGTVTLNNGGILNVNMADTTSTITFNVLNMTDNTLLDLSNGKTETLDIATFNVLSPADVAKVRLDIDLGAQTTDYLNVSNAMTNAVTLDFNAANILNNPGGRNVYYFEVANDNVNINDYNNPRVAVFSATNGYYISYLNMPPNLHPGDEYTYPKNTIRVTTEDVNDGLRDAVTEQGLRFFDITTLDEIHYVGNSAVNSGEGLLNMDVTTDGSYPGGTLTVRGNGFNGTISGAATLPGLTPVSLFKVDSSADDVSRTLNIEGGITIADAVGTNGAAVYLKDGATAGTANLNLDDVAFTSNQSSAQGGAIYNEGTVASTGTVIFGSSTDNTKGNTAGTNGGAIYNPSTATFNADTGFYNNSATAGSGGAVYNTGTLSLGSGTGSNIAAVENLASSGDGGFLYNDTAATTTINADNIGILSNQAQEGGAIYNAGTIVSTGTILFGDSTDNTKGNIAAVNGGAIYNTSTATFNASAGFYNNSATTGNGGAVYNEGSLSLGSGTGSQLVAVENLASSGNGGFLYNDAAGTATIGADNSSILSNQAQSGGAIYNAGSVISNGTVIFGDSTDNTKGNIAAINGGAIYNTSTATFNADTGFYNNSATAGSGGAVYNEGILTLGGGVGSTVEAAENKADNAQGGFLYNTTTGTTTINADNISISSNQAQSGGAVANTAGATFNVTASNILFSGNTALSSTTGGGAIYNDATGVANLQGNTVFTNNTSASQGGAIFNNLGSVTLGVDKTSIHNFTTNNAQDGAAIANIGGSVSVEGNAVFNGNTASAKGGAIYNELGSVIIGTASDNVHSFVANTAQDGGAVYSLNNNLVFIGQTTFTGNSATGDGGAVNTNFSDINFSPNTVFNSNSANKGGALFVNGSIVNIEEGTQFVNNTAVLDGAAIYMTGTTTDNAVVNINSDNPSAPVVFANNTSGNGNAIYLEQNSVLNLNASNNAGLVLPENIAGTDNNNMINVYADSDAPVTFKGNNSSYAGDFHLYTGDVYFTNGSTFFKGGNYTLDAGTELHLMNNQIDIVTAKSLNLPSADTPYMTMDGDLQTGLNDRFFTNSPALGNLTISDLNLMNENNAADTYFQIADGANVKPLYEGMQTKGKYYKYGIYSAPSGLRVEKQGLIDTSYQGGQVAQLGALANQYIIYNQLAKRAENLSIQKFYERKAKAQQKSAENTSEIAVNNEQEKVSEIYIPATEIVQAQEELAKEETTLENAKSQPEIAAADESGVKGETPFQRLFTKKNKKENPKVQNEFLKQNQELITESADIKEVSDKVQVAAAPAVLKQENTVEKTAASVSSDIHLNLDADVLPKSVDNSVILIDENKLPTLRSDYNQMISAQPAYDLNSGGVWVEPFTTIETISPGGLSGFKNFNYGVLLGYDLPVKTLDNGLELQSSIFGGYQGSNQDYDNVRNWQNGGFGGYMLNLYKGNAFSTVSLLAGGIGIDVQDNQGKNNQNYGMFTLGVSSKTGYNIGLPANLILQPNLTLAYSFLTGHEGQNAIGETIKVNALNNLLVTPGVKLIGDYKGWQPYLTAGFAFPLFGKTLANVNNINMPDVTLRPYIEYGGGVRKSFGERFAGFFEAVYRNGGRTGITFQGGFTIKF